MANFPEIPGYQIKKVLGRGGMATVYLAIQEKFDRLVALKVLQPSSAEDDTWAQRFMREAKTVAQMSHHAIVSVYDVGSVGPLHYMSMEYLPGGDLKAKMRQGLTVLDSVVIMKTIARGLDYAGSKKLVHRDIKPENILFREDGSPVISDFGISRLTDSKTNITVTGSMVGTPHYMSPEQAQGLEVDPRSDLYSLGIILYELLTGEVPFTGTSAVNIGIKHISEPPPPLPDELKGFQRVIDKALAKDPEERYQSGEEFCKALSLIEFSLSAQEEGTVMMSREEIQHLSGANERQRSAENTTRAGRTDGRRINTMDSTSRSPLSARLRDPRIQFAALAVAGTLVLAGVYVSTDSTEESSAMGTPDHKVQVVLKSTTERLLEKARQAMAEENYFSEGQENAQSYLTTLLAIDPEHQEARKMLRTLVNTYLDKSRDAIDQQDEAEADRWLKQASSLAFYIKDAQLNQRIGDVTVSMTQLRQHLAVSPEPPVSGGGDTEAETNAGDMSAAENAPVASAEEQSTEGQQGSQEPTPVLASDTSAGPEMVDEQGSGEAEAGAESVVTEMADAQPAPNEASASPDSMNTPDSGQSNGPESGEIASTRTDGSPAVDGGQVGPEDLAAIQDLLTKAQLAFKRSRLSRPSSDNAFSYYVAVLNRVPGNPEAIEGLRAVFEKYVRFVDNTIAARNPERARYFLESLKSVLDRRNEIHQMTEPVASLFSDYQRVAMEKEQALEKTLGELESALNELFAKADAVQRQGLTDSSNARIRQIYLQARKLSPNSPRVAEGLKRTSDYEADQARKALEAGDTVKALQHVAKISSTTPDYGGLKALRATVNKAERQAKVARSLLRQADEKMDFQYELPGLFGSNRDERKRLREAYALIRKAREAYPQEPGVRASLEKLQAQYVNIIKTLLKAGDREEARKFARDTTDYAWDSREIDALF